MKKKKKKNRREAKVQVSTLIMLSIKFSHCWHLKVTPCCNLNVISSYRPSAPKIPDGEKVDFDVSHPVCVD